MLTAPTCPTPPLYPTPRTLSSLAWDKLRYHSRGAAQSLRSARKAVQPVNRPSGYCLFLLYPASALMVRHYADSAKLSYTTTLSYTLRTPSTLDEKQSTKDNRPLVYRFKSYRNFTEWVNFAYRPIQSIGCDVCLLSVPS